MEDFIANFEKTQSRGPDSARTLEVGDGLMGFERLSIMGLTEEGMQPFLLNGNAVVCNGELYGFRKTKAELEKKGYEYKGVVSIYREIPFSFDGHIHAHGVPVSRPF